MKRFANISLKILSWILGTIVLLLLLASLLVYLFRNDIKSAAIKEANSYLSTRIEVHPDINISYWNSFPYIAVQFRDIKIYESIPGSDSLMGKAKLLQLNFNIQEVLQGNYSIRQIYLEDGQFNLKVMEDGTYNFSILKTDKKDSSATDNKKEETNFKLSDIILKSCYIDYEDRKLKQNYKVHSHYLKSSFAKEGENYKVKLRGNQLVKAITVGNNTYLKNKEIVINTWMDFKTGDGAFILNPSQILIDGSKYNASGNYRFGQADQIHFELQNNQSDIQSLLSLIPDKFASPLKAYKSEGDIYFKAIIDGVVDEQNNPSIQVDFGFKNASFYQPSINKKVSNAYMEGTYSNGSDKNSLSSTLTLKNIQCTLDGEKIEGNFKMENFSDPFIELQAKGQINLVSALPFIRSPFLKSARGKVGFNFGLMGKMADFKSKKGHEKIKTEGEIRLDSIDLEITEAKTKVSIVQTALLFNKNDVAVNEFKIRIGRSDLEFNGLIKNLFGCIFVENGKMLIQADLSSNYMQLEELFALIPKSAPVRVDQTNNEVRRGTFPYMEKYGLELQGSFKCIDYKKIHLTNIDASIDFKQPACVLDNVSFELCGGKVKASSSTLFSSDAKIETSLKADIKNLYIDSLLYMFDQFGQDFISDKQLKGIFTGNVQTGFTWNKSGSIDKSSLICSIDMSIEKGQLIQFGPMQKLSSFLSADELANIRFSELKNKILIEKEQLKIPDMTIQSNVADLTIAGTHNFSGQMNYNINFPLKNLKKHKVDPDAAFGAIEESKVNGTTVYLIISGTPDNISIKYDSRKTKKKIGEDLKKEKQELLQIFRKKEETIKQVQPNTQEFFDF